jgi:hypothetical protein
MVRLKAGEHVDVLWMLQGCWWRESTTATVPTAEKMYMRKAYQRSGPNSRTLGTVISMCGSLLSLVCMEGSANMLPMLICCTMV